MKLNGGMSAKGDTFAEKPQKIGLKGAEMLDALKAAFIRKPRA